jgi:hypothetical protein
MRQAGLKGARRGPGFVASRRDKAANRPPDRVNRDHREAPNLLWILDFERHKVFANPWRWREVPPHACRSRRVEAGGRSITSARGWLVEQSSATLSSGSLGLLPVRRESTTQRRRRNRSKTRFRSVGLNFCHFSIAPRERVRTPHSQASLL